MLSSWSRSNMKSSSSADETERTAAMTKSRASMRITSFRDFMLGRGLRRRREEEVGEGRCENVNGLGLKI